MFSETYGRFMGNRKIMREILRSAKASLLSPTEKFLVLNFGNIALFVFGYPLQIIRRHIRVFLLRYLDKNEVGVNSTVLDIGCGLGYDAFTLSLKYSCKVIGIDLDETSVKLANSIKRTLKIRKTDFQVDNILESKIQEEFDLVLFFEVIEHIKDDEKALCEINKRLKKKGLLILAAPYSDTARDFKEPRAAFQLKQELPKSSEEFVGGFHWREGYNEESLKRLLQRQGFTVLRVNYVKLPSAIARLESVALLFPLLYPISRLLSNFSSNKTAIVLKAQKN
jgi:2-polyprenyl-3-methyl-5-hydroxy-6-metoxy-1,4-benzoquinol methylase